MQPDPETLKKLEALTCRSTGVNLERLAEMIQSQKTVNLPSERLGVETQTLPLPLLPTDRTPTSPKATRPKRASGSASGSKSSKPSKYRNKRITIEGVTWDSRKEFRRWQVLYPLFAAGRITHLRRQTRWKITVNGVRVCAYVDDFNYRLDGRLVVEDCKSEFTRKLPVYRLKRRLMKACHGIDIKEL